MKKSLANLTCILLTGGLIGVALFSAASTAKAGARTVGFGKATVDVGDQSRACGAIHFNGDGTYEDGFAWSGAGIEAPAFGAFAECYSFDGHVCLATFDFTQTGAQAGQTMDVYLWEDDGGIPGVVVEAVVGVDPGPIAPWPSISRHDVPLNSCVHGDYWVGYWGNWPGATNGWFIAADLDGPNTGCPFTNYGPGSGFPTGWANVEAAFGPTAALGIGAEVSGCPAPCDVTASYTPLATEYMDSSDFEYVAQVITAEIGIDHPFVTLELESCKENGLVDGQLEIVPAPGGVPDWDNPLGTDVVPEPLIPAMAGCVPGTFGDVVFEFPGVSLSPGTQYALVLKPVNGNGSIVWRRSSFPTDPLNPYPGGNLWTNGEFFGEMEDTNLDLQFRVCGEQPTFAVRFDVDGSDAPAGETETGFVRMTDPGMSGDAGTGAFSPAGTSNGVTVTATGGNQYRDRGTPPPPQTYPQLTRDFIGVDGAGAEVTVTISGLPGGEFRVTSFHLDWFVWSNLDLFDIAVDDVLGTERLVVNDADVPNDTDHLGFSYTVFANGVDDVVLHLREDSATNRVRFNGLIIEAADGVSTDVGDASGLPGLLQLSRARPNPFHASTRLDFALPRTARVEFNVYDVQGRRVVQLASGERPAGTHHAVWSGLDEKGHPVQSGVYFVRLQATDADGTTGRVQKVLRVE